MSYHIHDPFLIRTGSKSEKEMKIEISTVNCDSFSQFTTQTENDGIMFKNYHFVLKSEGSTKNLVYPVLLFYKRYISL